MKLIANSSSTKTNWCLVENNKQRIYFDTEGYNSLFLTRQCIIAAIYQGFPELIIKENITEIHFYGECCSSDKIPLIKDALMVIFKNAILFVESELLAAARTVLGNQPGFIAVLETGSNTGIYSGGSIIEHIGSLGFILGDEGGGSAIGKRILLSYIRDTMNDKIRNAFWHTYHMSKDEIFEYVYVKPLANVFCAGFCEFLNHPDVDTEYCQSIVKSVFDTFFKSLVIHYPNYRNFNFNCVGSVGFQFQSILKEVVRSYQMEWGCCTDYMIKDIVDFHEKII